MLCVGYKKKQYSELGKKGRNWGLPVSYFVERRLLGTGGAVKNTESLNSTQSVIVLNDDTLVGVNLRNLVSFHQSRAALATIITVRVADHERYGPLKLDRQRRITTFLKKVANIGIAPER